MSFPRIFVPILAAAALATGSASAEQVTDVTFQFTYDTSAITSADSAHNTLEKIEKKASQACETRRPVSGTVQVDRDCYQYLVSQTVQKISNKTLSQTFVEKYGAQAVTLADLNVN